MQSVVNQSAQTISNAELAGHLSSFLRGAHGFDKQLTASIEGATLVMLNNYRDEVIDVGVGICGSQEPAQASGINRYGLDAGYMTHKLETLIRDAGNYRPDEAARVLARLAKVADESVLNEIEFAAKRQAPCERFCESRAFKIEIRQLNFELERLRAVKAGPDGLKVQLSYKSALDSLESYIESVGGVESNGWHDAPVDGVFLAGFEAGRKSAPVPAQQATEGFALIPLDPRNGSPKITNEMKAQCIGEFEFEIDEPCPKCALHLNEHYEDVECFCGGSDDLMYQKKISVPWDSVKLIYKGMAQASMQKSVPAKQGDADSEWPEEI